MAVSQIGRGKVVTKRKARSREEWSKIIANADNIKESLAEYCEQHGVSLQSFYKWRNIFEKVDFYKNKRELELVNGSGLGFIEIKPSSNAPQSCDDSATRIRSRFTVQGSGGGLKFEFISGCSLSELKVVRSLLSC